MGGTAAPGAIPANIANWSSKPLNNAGPVLLTPAEGLAAFVTGGGESDIFCVVVFGTDSEFSTGARDTFGSMTDMEVMGSDADTLAWVVANVVVIFSASCTARACSIIAIL